jgi:hypothetical protein
LLAASTENEIPGHRSKRRTGTAAEAAVLRALAVQWLRDYGLDPQLLRQGTMAPVTSTELRAGEPAIIGRLDVRSKRAIRRLFAVAEREGSAYHLTLAVLDIQRDLDDGVDASEREYVDQLDINNDGIDELFTVTYHYETWTYTIWQFDAKSHTWREAYTGGGGGC